MLPAISTSDQQIDEEKERERLRKLKPNIIDKVVNCSIVDVGDFSGVVVEVREEDLRIAVEVEKVGEFVPLKIGALVLVRPTQCIGRVN